MVATATASFAATGSSNHSNSSSSNVLIQQRGKGRAVPAAASPVTTAIAGAGASGSPSSSSANVITSSTIIHSPTLTHYPPLISSPRSDFNQKQPNYRNVNTMVDRLRIRNSPPTTPPTVTAIPVVKASNVRTTPTASYREVLKTETCNTEPTILVTSKRVDKNDFMPPNTKTVNEEITSNFVSRTVNNDTKDRQPSEPSIPNTQIPSCSSISSSNTGSCGTTTTATYATSSSNNNHPNDTVTDDSTYNPIGSSSYSAHDTTTFDDGTNNSILLEPNYHAVTADHSFKNRQMNKVPSPKRTKARMHPLHEKNDTSSLQHQCDAAAQCSPCFGTPLSRSKPMSSSNNGRVNGIDGFFQSATTRTTTPNHLSDIRRNGDNHREQMTNLLSNDSTLSDMTTHTGNHTTAPTSPLVHNIPMNHDDVIAGTTGSSFDNNISDPTVTHSNQNSPNWWIQMFQQIETQHAQERSTLQQELQTVTMKQSQYKLELKNTIAQQLQWLEQRIMLPQHILPNLKGKNGGTDSHSTESTLMDDASATNITPTEVPVISSPNGDNQNQSRTNTFHTMDDSTNHTHGLSSANEGRNENNEHSHHMHQRNDEYFVSSAPSYGSANMGIEMTYDSAVQVQRVQELEQCLSETIHQYHNDRLEWIRTLEEAAKLTTTSEQVLYEQQEEQIATIQNQITTQHKHQKKQWKEKIRVLSELLKLTEHQHAAEKQQWDQERIQHETTIRQFMDDMNGVVLSMDSISNENNQYQLLIQDYQAKILDLEKQVQNRIKDIETERTTLAKEHSAAINEVQTDMDLRMESLRQELRLQHEKELDNVREDCKLQHQKQIEQKVHFFQLNSLQEKAELEADLVKSRQQNDEHQKEIERLQQDAEVHEKEMDSLRNDFEKIRAESNTFRTYAADFTEQATLSRNQCTVLQKNLALAADPKHPSKLPPSSLDLLSSDLDNKLDRAIAERDLCQQEVVSLQNNNASLQQQVSVLQKQLEDIQNIEAGSRVEVDHPLGTIVTTETQSRTELATKYKELVEKHSELIGRLKRIEEHRIEERSVWKVQLESALAETRTLRDHQQHHDKTIKHMTDQHGIEINGLKVQLQQVRTDRKRQFDELIRLCSGTDGTLNESQVIQHLQQRVEEIETVMEQRCHTLVNKHTAEVHVYKSKIDQLTQRLHDAENEINLLTENHFIELSELQERFEDVEKESNVTILTLQRHGNENADSNDDDDERTQVMSNTKKQIQLIQQQRKFEATLAENNALIDRVDELSKELVEFKRLHYSATKKYERAILDRNGYKDELETLRRLGSEYTVHQEVSGRLERHQFLFLNAIDELREDMTSIRQNVEANCQADKESESLKYEQLREDLFRIQNSLNDAVAEITLDADAMMQSRDVLQTVASDVSEKLLGTETKNHILDKQEHLLSEMSALCEYMKKSSVGSRSIFDKKCINENVELSRELIAELQEKEAALAVAQTELRHCKEQLESEIASRQMVDGEIVTLHDQADSYEDEISMLQSANKKLVAKLRAMGIQLDASLLSDYMRSNFNMDDCNSAIGSPRLRTGHNEDDSLIVLDEALALAEDLTNIVHCRSRDREQTAMEMLESMSEMMEVHELRSASQDVTSPRSSPRQQKNDRRHRRHRKIFSEDEQNDGIEVIHEVDDDDDDSSSVNWFCENNNIPRLKPTPIETTPPAEETTAAVTECKLQMVVEQLYGRCQLLERERVEMMEVTLDLLESAREANNAQLEAALATARRKTTEDIIRVRDESRQEQERIFHKICKSYVVGTKR